MKSKNELLISRIPVSHLGLLHLLGPGEVAPDAQHAGVAHEEEVDQHGEEQHHCQAQGRHPGNIQSRDHHHHPNLHHNVLGLVIESLRLHLELLFVRQLFEGLRGGGRGCGGRPDPVLVPPGLQLVFLDCFSYCGGLN